MRIIVFARANAKQDKVGKLDSGQYRVFVKSPPEKGKANEQITKVLADFFAVSKSQVEIIRGHKQTIKTIEISK